MQNEKMQFKIQKSLALQNHHPRRFQRQRLLNFEF
jgi:hypothetical protein